MTRDELNNAIEDAGLTVLRSLNAGRGVQVKRQLAEMTKTELAVFVYIFTAYKSEPPKKTLIQTLPDSRPHAQYFFHDGSKCLCGIVAGRQAVSPL